MFAVSPVASTTVAASRPPQIDAPERVASVIASMVPTPVALDPRPGFALSTQAADAVLALSRVKGPAPETVTPFMQHAGLAQRSDTAAQAAVAADARPAGNAGGTITSESGALAGLAGNAVSADIDRTAIEIQTAHRVDEAMKWDAYLYSGARVASDAIDTAGIYLLCNNIHYNDYKTDHPNIDIHWINIDSKKIVSVWRKMTEPWFATS